MSIEKTGNKFVVIIDKGGTIAVVKENRKPVTKGQIDLTYMASVPDPTSKVQIFPPPDTPQNIRFNVFEQYSESDAQYEIIEKFKKEKGTELENIESDHIEKSLQPFLNFAEYITYDRQEPDLRNVWRLN